MREVADVQDAGSAGPAGKRWGDIQAICMTLCQYFRLCQAGLCRTKRTECNGRREGPQSVAVKLLEWTRWADGRCAGLVTDEDAHHE